MAARRSGRPRRVLRARHSFTKYAYLATRAEIAENDFNLNIPRYVDTFEEEIPPGVDTLADLEAVRAYLQNK